MTFTIIKVEKVLEGKDWPQIVAILIGSFVAFTSGLLYAWPSPFLLKITQDKVHYNISENEASYFTIVHAAGMLTLPILLVSIAQIIGRKTLLNLSTIPYITSFVLKAVCTNIWLLYLARFLAGAGDAIVFAALPVYIGEIATPKIRGIWGNSFIIAVFLGQCGMNIIGSYCNVQVTSYIGLAIPVIFLIIFSFMPESPYYLIMRNRQEEAKSSLRWLRCKEDVESEFENMKSSVEKQESGSWGDLLRIKANRKALTAGVFLRISQLLTGVYVFAAYTQFIFAKAGGNISPQMSAIIYTGVTVIMYSCAAYLSNKMGRRQAYMISIFLAGLVVLSEATYFYLDTVHPEINLESYKWYPLVGMILFVVVSSFGVGIIPTLMLGELFATSIKPKGISVLTCTFAASIMITNNIFYYLNSATGLYGPFYLFGFCNIVFTFIAYFVVPETKGKTLDEIQQFLNDM
ncbi:facilitated trehalose transporter Tret1 isoform X2 [Diabrotica virgifera virgifera]|uniref:Facilitated trehalose transporter Tret1-like isoform X4 n=1 Tax=Diabrotica virgifera virgifera TaxID=50390 RepID=A0A6P7GC83_DIAVI|nr:facilitated trehalose transporter Tret1 isoform X2 [Diabrotica virgifera virgifera]